MVFESVAEMVLSKLLDKVFYGINKKNIQVALLDGKFVLSNIGLQPSLLAQLNLPIQLKYSYVEKLEIHLPWREEQVSLTVNISNIYLLLASVQSDLNLFQVFMKRKQRIIEAALKQFKSLQQKQQNKKQYGYIQKLLLNLLDNVNIKIQCIHLRCENKQKKYSFGIKINEVSARTADNDDRPCFFNREKSTQEYIRYVVEMDFMGIYFNSKEDYFLSERSLAEITDEFHRLSHKRFRNYSQNYDSQQASDNFNYILTISLRTIVKKYINALQRLTDNKDQKYLFQCAISLNKIQSKISDQQYYDLLDIINLINDYQKTYLDYVSHRQLPTYKQRKAKDISQLLFRKKKLEVVGRREKETIKKNCRKYMGWIFRQTFQEILKKSFIKQAIRKQVNIKNLKQNPKTLAIMKKIDNQKLKLWILISLFYRQKYQEKVSVFLRSIKDKQDSFASKYILNYDLFQPCQIQQQISRLRQNTQSKYQVFLKLVLNVREVAFEISREDNLGVGFKIETMRAQLILRQKNYSLNLTIADLQGTVFHSKKNQKLKNYVPIIKRSCVLDKTVSLLQLTYQRNPVGKPFVFTEIDARLQSIEITIYPEAFKQFYSILLGNREQSQGKKRKGKKKQVVQDDNNRTLRQIGHQKTIIKCKVRTPWIVVPLSAINDPSQECWIARLGDFYIDTPQHDIAHVKTQQEIFYEQYKLQLKRFQLSYFTSVNFFHNWMKFNYSMQSLRKIKSYQKQRIITLIDPFSCFAECSLLKSSLSTSIKDRKPQLIAKIMIDQVRLRASKFLLGKLKYRIDQVMDQGTQPQQQFVQSDINNIKEQNQFSGYCKVSYLNLNKMKFYCILKGSFIYFFLNEQYHKYHLFVNITEVAIRLISNEVQNFNSHFPKLLCLYLTDNQSHYHWRKKIHYILAKKDRRKDTRTMTNFRNSYSEQIQRSTIIPQKQRQKQKQKQKQKPQQSQSSPGSKLSLAFLMNKLSIQLYEGEEDLFMDCNFKKATLQYSTVSEKSLKFSLNQWTVCEGDGKLFAGSNSFFEQQGQQGGGSNLNNFLEVCCSFNSITQELKSIDIKIDKLFLAWKVQLFTKILVFFFYDEQMGDVPTPANHDKKQLQIKISLQKFNFYCYFASELIALTKLQFLKITYFQNSIQQRYDVDCSVFELDKYVNGSRQHRLPMIRRKNQFQDSSGHGQTVYNNFILKYILRKKQTQKYENVERLKGLFGKQALVSQIDCQWSDTEIIFENQLTFRVLNYILGKVLGTVASKFKKRQFSPNYIFQSLKTTKISVFDIVLNNFVFRIPPHERGLRQFQLSMTRLRVSKNNDDINLPKSVRVKTILQPQSFFWQSLVVKIIRADLSYQIGKEQPIRVTSSPFNINLIYSKMNFQKQYFVILKHHDDIDRKATIDVIIQQPVIVQAHKIMFITFLQIFYQNIKHKDGMAEIFQPPLPFPSIRQYDIYIQKVGFNMYHFLQKNSTMVPFNKMIVDRFKLNYKQFGQDSAIRLQGETITSTGQLPIYIIDGKRKKFLLEMNSKEGEMKVIINAEYYALEVDLDLLNNIIEFINYDNDYVINKVMPKKKSSWQYVNVFTRNCQLRLGALRAQGEFYISYLKGMKNDPQNEAKQYLIPSDQLDSVLKDPTKLNWDDIVDKQIKVNGQDIRLSINGDPIGGASSFCFNRIDLTSKATNRRFKKEKIQVGYGSLHVQLVDLLTIWQVYNSNIRKKSTFVLKNFYEPWDQLAAKVKSVQKRCTEVQIQKLAISILPNSNIEMIRYIRIDLQFPLIIYRTFKDQQQVLVNIVFNISHHKKHLKQMIVGGCKTLKIRYLNFKDRKEKSIDILMGKNIVFNLYDINSRIIQSIMEEVKSLKTVSRSILHLNSNINQYNYPIILRNEGNKRVKINFNKVIVISAYPNQQQKMTYSLEAFLQILDNPKSFIEIHQEGSEIIRKNSNEINLYSPTKIKQSFTFSIISTPKQTLLIYKCIYTIKNSSSGQIVLKDRRKLKRGDTASVIPIKSLINIQFSNNGWRKQIEISLKHQQQLFGEESFAAKMKKTDQSIIIEIVDRYVIKNITSFTFSVNQKEVLPNQELSLGYIPSSKKGNYSFMIGNDTVAVNFNKNSQKIPFFSKITKISRKSSSEQKTFAQLRTELIITKNIIVAQVYFSLCIKNLTKQTVLIQFEEFDYLIKEGQSIAIAASYENLKLKDCQQYQTLVFNKNKEFYSKNFKTTLISRLQKKAYIIKIQSKYTILNNSCEFVDILGKNKKTNAIIPTQTYQLMFQQEEKKVFTLIFDKFYPKKIDFDKKGINFIEVQEKFYKITMLSKEQKLLIIQDSEVSHTIINKLDNISIIAYSRQQKQEQQIYSLVDICDQEIIDRLIKPGEQKDVGIYNWNNPCIELQFYLQSKNIQFKQTFKIDFNNIQLGYSNKVVLHDQKEKKNVFILIITVQKDSEGRFTITAYRQKDYQELPMQKMKVSIQQISITFIISNQSADNITFQCTKAMLTRQKGIELTDFDIQISRFLIREGQNVSIMNALNTSRFLTAHLILSKTPKGLGINNLFVKLTPLEIICRQKLIFKILEKIVEVRAFSAARRSVKDIQSEYSKSFRSQSKLIDESLLKQFSQEGLRMEKTWEQQLKQAKKGTKKLIINNLQLSETSLFITYSKQQYRQFDQKIASDNIIKYMLLLPSISELKMSVPHLKINEFEGDTKQLTKQIVSRLKQSIGGTIANSFSALPFFDNPIIVIDSIFKYIDGMLSIQ